MLQSWHPVLCHLLLPLNYTTWSDIDCLILNNQCFIINKPSPMGRTDNIQNKIIIVFTLQPLRAVWVLFSSNVSG